MGVEIRGVYFPSLTQEDADRIERDAEMDANWHEGIGHLHGMAWLMYNMWDNESTASLQEHLGWALHHQWYWNAYDDQFGDLF